MIRCNGTNFDNIRAFVHAEHGGEDGWKRVLKRLEEKDAALLEKVDAGQWYDFELQVKLLVAIEAEHGDPITFSVLKRYGEFDAARDLNGIKKVFARLVTKTYLLKVATKFWRTYFDQGTWQVVRRDDGADGELRDFDPLHRAFCETTTAYLRRLMELVGARNVVATHPTCKALGHEHCTYKVTWRR